MASGESIEQKDGRSYPYQEDEIALIDLLKVIWKWKGFIVITFILFCVAGLMFSYKYYPVKHITEVDILLNFSGIEEHKNPDGTLFETRQIVNPKMINMASNVLKNNSLEIPIRNLIEMISINPIIPPEIEKQIKAAETKNESYVFYPNMFRIALTEVKTALFTERQRINILLSIIDEYKKEFKQK